jgi:predicted tellurium resistance membrane protein TerC
MTIAKSSLRPYLPYAGITVLVAIGAIASMRWAPWMWGFLYPGYSWRAELAFFGSSILAILISQHWRFRRRLSLWGGLAVLVIVNAIAVRLFINHVRHFIPGDYILVIFCEMFVSEMFLAWRVRGRRDKSSRDSAEKAEA